MTDWDFGFEIDSN